MTRWATSPPRSRRWRSTRAFSRPPRRTPPSRAGGLLRVTVFNPLEYATVVEFGRRPRQGAPPPLLPLVGWAGRKGIISSLPRNISFDGQWKKDWLTSLMVYRAIQKRRGGGVRKKQSRLSPVVRDMLIVRMIAGSIFEKGTKGKRPFSRTWDRKAATFLRDVAEIARLLP